MIPHLFYYELVASFVNCLNPLKSWEKNRHRRGQCIRSVQAKKRGDHAHSSLILCYGSPPFFWRHRSRMQLWPYTLAHASSFGVTENSQPVQIELIAIKNW